MVGQREEHGIRRMVEKQNHEKKIEKIIEKYHPFSLDDNV